MDTVPPAVYIDVNAPARSRSEAIMSSSPTMRIMLSATSLMLAVTGAAVVAPSAAGIAVDLKQAQAKGVPLTPEEATVAAGKPAPAAAGSDMVKCFGDAKTYSCSRNYQVIFDGVPGAANTTIAGYPSNSAATAALKAAAKPAAGAKVLSASGTKVVTVSTPAPGAKAVEVRVLSGPNHLKAICVSSGSSVKQIQACAARLIAAMQKKLASVA
jgi:hypothetical protein